MPTAAVEDYLKAIYLLQEERPGELVPTGRIALALQVSPGTVTAMMKTLTDAGLVDYEPYAGVRLSSAGAKLATHVLRRHRLIELFLVKIMGMDWSAVHDEAEVLEHAVSDRLLERIDEMLDRPSADPHGDPIPSALGQVDRGVRTSLVSCPLGVEVRVVRITDQRPEFLQSMERAGLVPGSRAIVELRDPLGETLQIRPSGGEPLRVGYPAGSRILVAVD